jgi:hypothetical protein
MNTFDQLSRYVAKDDPSGFIRWALPRLADRLRFARWLDAQNAPRPGDAERRCDTLAELVDAEGTSPPWCLVLEFFTRADPDATDRTLEYAGRYRRDLRHGPQNRDRYQFAAVLVFLTGSAPDAVEMTLPGQDDVSLCFRPRPLAVAEQDAVATLAAIGENRYGRCVLPWVPLMRGGDRPEVIAAWKEQAERIEERARRQDYGAVALAFAGLTGFDAVWRKALEGWDVEESHVFNEWMAKREARIRRKDILQVVELRFPGSVSSELTAAVERQNDLNELSRWHSVAVTAADLAGVKAVFLGESTTTSAT